MDKKKRIDLAIIFLIFLFSTLLILYFKLTYLPAVLLYFAVPSVYLSFKKKKAIKKVIIYAFLASLIPVFVLDYIATISNAWWEQSTLGIRVLNVFPIDSFIWTFFFFYFIIIFYEYFFEKENKINLSRNIKYLIFILLSVGFLFGLIYFWNKELLIIKDFYIIFLLILEFMPMLIILYNHPRLIRKFTIQGAVFALFGITYELVAVSLGHWGFNGINYIGWVTLFGVGFPFEELLFLLFSVPAILGIYEFFADDEK